ncbi:cupin domain-containing protein [Alcaligenes sp. 13f]|uniref:cupin domain-containing protein n=1 Tax=Alcaligenes sp. 13f TaxID=2841924 RepID=UPI001CF6B5A4|nr:cupin domain-containing protein [Alcaligenes sp. 13f]MCB4322001.1 cupin domain-containing protein [Alcaligenes sp. 13f]
MTLFATLCTEATPPDISTVDQADLISGTPEFRLWELECAGEGMSAGVWESTPGKWRFSNQHWEYFHVRSGVSIVTEAGGQARTVRAGDSVILRAGFQGTWEVVETTRKEYVVRES